MCIKRQGICLRFTFFALILFTKCGAYSLFRWTDTILRSIAFEWPAERFDNLSILFSKGLEYTGKCETPIENANPITPIFGTAATTGSRISPRLPTSGLFCLLSPFTTHSISLPPFNLCEESTRWKEGYLLSLNKGRPEQNLAYPRKNWFTYCTPAVQFRIPVSKVGFLVYQAIRPL